MLQDQTLSLEVDAGAGANSLSQENWKKLGEPTLNKE